MATAAIAGLMAPDMVLRRIRSRYLTALDAGIPDALDMMVICGQAGLGMETSIERVGIEIRHAHTQVADELTRTAHEMQVNADTRLALVNLSKRTGLDGMRRLATVLIQSMQFGTPLSQALRALSAEQRQEMLAKFEAKAGRLPVLLTLPIVPGQRTAYGMVWDGQRVIMFGGQDDIGGNLLDETWVLEPPALVVAPTYHRVYGLEFQLTNDGVEAPVTVRTSAQSQQT